MNIKVSKNYRNETKKNMFIAEYPKERQLHSMTLVANDANLLWIAFLS